jgi:Glyceraldehyde 3-phosphate dehydrogenase, NAD binding domain
VAVNDPFLTPEYAAYQFKYDSVHGIYPADVSHEEGYLIVGDVRIKFFSERNPAGTCMNCFYLVSTFGLDTSNLFVILLTPFQTSNGVSTEPKRSVNPPVSSPPSTSVLRIWKEVRLV